MFTSEDKETFRCYRVDITDTMVKKRKKMNFINKDFDEIFRCVCIMFWEIEQLKVNEDKCIISFCKFNFHL